MNDEPLAAIPATRATGPEHHSPQVAIEQGKAVDATACRGMY